MLTSTLRIVCSRRALVMLAVLDAACFLREATLRDVLREATARPAPLLLCHLLPALHGGSSGGCLQGKAEQESQHAVQAGESSRQQDDLDEAAIATNPESNLLEPLRARGFAGGRRSLYAPTAVDGRPRGYEPKVPSGFSDSNGGFACCGDVHCNVCAEKRS